MIDMCCNLIIIGRIQICDELPSGEDQKYSISQWNEAAFSFLFSTTPCSKLHPQLFKLQTQQQRLKYSNFWVERSNKNKMTGVHSYEKIKYYCTYAEFTKLPSMANAPMLD